MMKLIKGIGLAELIKCRPFLFFISFLFSFYIVPVNAQKDGGWVLSQSSEGIDVYVQNDEFHDVPNGLHYEYVLIKLVNTNSSPVNVILSYDLFYDGLEYGKGDKEQYVFYIPAGGYLAGDCCNTVNPGLRIFSRFLNYTNKPVLTQYTMLIKTVE